MGSVSELRQFPRSFISAAEHVGKHSDGVAGWRACADSGGMSDAGGVVRKLPSQPSSVRSIGSSISRCPVSSFFRIVNYSRLGFHPLTVFVSFVGQVFDLLGLTGDGGRLVGVMVAFPVTPGHAYDDGQKKRAP